MRRYAAVIAIAALAVTPAAFAKPAPTLAHLAGLTEKDYMKGLPWEDAAFKAALAVVLKPKATLGRLYYSGPVEGPLKALDGGTILAWACRAHDCYSVQGNVFIEPAANRLYVCWHDDERDPAHDWWLAKDKAPEALAPGVCRADGVEAIYRAHAAAR